MFSGLASFLPWSGAKLPATGSVDIDLEGGDGNRPPIDDGRLSSVSSFRALSSSASGAAEADLEPGLPQEELENDPSTSGCGAGPPSEESATAAVPRFITTRGRSSSTPPEILRVKPPHESTHQQLQDEGNPHTATSSSPSASSNHSYTRFFYKTRTPKRTRSTRSLGPGGIHNGLGVLSPIYEPSNPNTKELTTAQKGPQAGESSTFPKTHAPSIHSTTSTIQDRIMSLQATHPTFLKRSLKWSFSQTSSSSLHSEASGAPQLPPLHFRPAFTGTSMGTLPSPSAPPPGPPSATCSTPHPPRVVVPARPPPSITTSPQRSQLSHSQPNTPQSLTTPRSHRFGSLDHLHKCSAIYEDSCSEKSFVTATSGETEPGPGVITKHDIPSTADLVTCPEDRGQTGELLEHVEGYEGNVRFSSSNVVIPMTVQPHVERGRGQHHSKAFSEPETTFNVTSDSQHGHNPVSSAIQRQNRIGTASFMSIGSTTIKNESTIADDRVVEETATIVEDDRFIMERWTKTLFYSASGNKELFSAVKGGDRKQPLASSTRVLFWVGFIAPWCWLVGGWMPPRGASVLENEMKYEKLRGESGMGMERAAVARGEDGTGLKKWIMPDPSSSFKATARAPSISNATTLYPMDIEEARLVATDPWVRRCRIASIVGGAILGLGLITMVIVLGVVTDMD